jgi:putative flavoprotein involved in K+ transport
MPHVDTVIVGGSQSGLAMSRALTDRGVEHVVLERGRIGARWRADSWDSLRLLTPRWLSRIGGWSDAAGDPDAFMHWRELVDYLEAYGRSFCAPVLENTGVQSARRRGGRFEVSTSTGTWMAERLVVATGHSQSPMMPECAHFLDRRIEQITATDYRRPSALPPGGVLVVGSSATGVQLAAELRRSGREVVLAVGRHTRLPRRYRGRDIMEWLHALGSLGQRTDDVGSLTSSRAQPSLQLVGSAPGEPDDVDLGVLQAMGVRLTGRVVGAQGTRVLTADDLVENIAAAEFKYATMRGRIDRVIERDGLEPFVTDPDPFRPVPIPDSPAFLNLRRLGIRTVVWATGFRRSYPWIEMPALDAAGEIRQRGGVGEMPGLYTMGLNFQRRRSSSFLVGVADDALELARHMDRARDQAPTRIWAVA